jgi:ribonuclease P protein component
LIRLIPGIGRRATFERLRKEGIRVRRGSLGLTYLPLAEGETQVAFAINRRVGTAVVRNRTRRRLRAALDTRRRTGHLPDGAYLVQVTEPLDAIPFGDVETALDKALGALESRIAS